MNQPLTVGILGGMGPHATISFLDQIVRLTPAAKDWDHLHMIVDNHPKIPSRTRHILYDEPSPVPGMLDACRRLQSYPVDFIALPCNSACYFLDQITPYIDIPILSIMEETVRSLVATNSGSKRCVVLGGRVTYAMQTYAPLLEAAGIHYIHHTETTQKQIEALIEAIKLTAGNADNTKRSLEIIHTVVDEYQAGCVILGCTEFGCVKGTSFPFPVIDSSYALAQSVVKRALKEQL